MGQWFYAEGNRQQRGPLASEELIALYQSSRIAADTLVWRDGMAQWQPLREVADEIGLVLAAPPPAEADPTRDPQAITDTPAVALPPQIPLDSPAPVQVPPVVVTPPIAAAVPPQGAAPVAPRQVLSGCAIAGIIAGVCGVLLLAVIGMLAWIAVPAYQEYVLRAKTTAAVAALQPIKLQVAEFLAVHGRCPVNDDDGFQPADSYADDALSAVRIGRFDNSHCGIEAELAAPGKAAVDGKLLWLDYDADQQQWECTAEPDDNYLPQQCRG